MFCRCILSDKCRQFARLAMLKEPASRLYACYTVANLLLHADKSSGRYISVRGAERILLSTGKPGLCIRIGPIGVIGGHGRERHKPSPPALGEVAFHKIIYVVYYSRERTRLRAAVGVALRDGDFYLELERRTQKRKARSLDKLTGRRVGHVSKKLIVVGDETRVAIETAVYPVHHACGYLCERGFCHSIENTCSECSCLIPRLERCLGAGVRCDKRIESDIANWN